MSTYVLMRVLESAPRRYTLGIRLLTLGGVDRAYDRLASHIQTGQRVLDLGCGAGALTLRAAKRGATVKGIDINPQMLEIARERVRKESLTESVELVELGVAELEVEAADSYDVVTCGLCFSELSDDELSFTLEQLERVLKPGGLVLVADEVRPLGLAARAAHSLIRVPLAAVTYIITQQTTRPISNLTVKLEGAGFSIVSVNSSGLRSFTEIIARKPAVASP
jgi:ubiquinone/menaquinone biosynthesis C-methylase UbiE